MKINLLFTFIIKCISHSFTAKITCSKSFFQLRWVKTTSLLKKLSINHLQICFITCSLLAATTFASFGNTHNSFIEEQKVGGEIRLIHFKKKSIATASLPQLFNDAFRLSKDYQFRHLKSFMDKIGYQHKQYQQLYKYVPISGKVVTVHSKKNEIVSMSGETANRLHLSPIPVLPESAALAIALQAFPAQWYKWEFPQEEKWLQHHFDDPQASYFPKGELVIMAQDADFSRPDNFKLCWQFELYAHQPLKKANLYINAHNGEVVFEENLLCLADEIGSADTKYSNTQPIVTDSFTDGFRLQETGRGNGIETYNMNEGTFYFFAEDFVDNDNNWTAAEYANAAQDNAALDAHWGAEMTYDYYLDVLGRNSYDDAGTVLQSYVHYNVNFSNAFWDGTRMTYGDGNGTTTSAYTALDICGHEITHALISETSKLTLFDEAGALNESFADIFGTAIEFYAKPATANWTVGEDIGILLRSMSNPSILNNPDTYKGLFWATGEADNGGIHTNSSVQNYWFYLLSQGGSGTNDIGQSYNVAGIGIEKAEQIAYRNLSVYLSRFSEYEDAAFFAKQAAADLYGICSQEYISTVDAWHAVGLGNAHTATLVPDFEASPTSFCVTAQSVDFFNKSTGASSYLWDFGDGMTSTDFQPTHFYNSPGNYTVSLTATACNGSQLTETKTGYIIIEANENCAYTMTDSPQTITNCTGSLYDTGGGIFNYADEQDNIVSIAPTGASTVTLHFLNFNLETDFDYLSIYDGADTTATLLGAFTGNFLPNGGMMTSSGNSITLRLSSDEAVNKSGFELYWVCDEMATETIICPATATATNLGTASNVFSMVNNRPNQIAVDNDLNTITFVHRNNASAFGGHSGFLRYDVSTDGGATWQLDQGVMNPTANNSMAGRYPQAIIYNPTGNTDPNNAYLSYYAPNTEGFGWAGYVSGMQRLNGATTTDNYNQTTSELTEVPGGLCESTSGNFWAIDRLIDNTAIRIFNGVWNGAINDVEWTTHTTFSIDRYAALTPIIDFNMAFDPSGTYGWAIILTHLSGTTSALQYYPVFSRTTDGGVTWTNPEQIDLMQFPTLLENLPFGEFPACGRELDIAVDINGHPHILLNIGSGNGENYNLNTGAFRAMYHLRFDNSTWAMNRLAHLETYTADIGNSGATVPAVQYNRPQMSRSEDGTKIVFAWADSDASITNGLNNAPNLFVKSYGATTQNYSDTYNFSACTALEGQILFATVSPILKENGSIFTLPVAYAQLHTSGNELNPTAFYYLNGVTLDACDFGSLVPQISVVGETELCEGQSSILNAGSGFSSYQWSTGSSSQAIIANMPGLYTVTTIDSEGCENMTSITLTEDNCAFTVQINMLLEGAYNSSTNLMSTILKDNDLLPLSQPYNRVPWNYQGGESVSNFTAIPENVSDWVLVELRDGTDNEQVVGQRAAFLKNDGTLIDLDGSVGVDFEDLDEGDYFIVIRHRNHLAVISENVVTLPNAIPFDVTEPVNIFGGTGQLTEIEAGLYALYAGDFDSNGTITVSDFNLYATQTAQINVYLDGDCNLDKAVTVADFNIYQPNASVIGVDLVRY